MRCNKKLKGFTLTELAIVLAALGLLLGGVWAAVSVVWSNYRLNVVKDDLFQTVQNVQSYYAHSSALPGANNALITATLDNDTRRLIPVSMRATPAVAGGNINHALSSLPGGSFRVRKTGDRVFRIELHGLSQEHCQKLLMQIPVLLPELGVVRMAANGSNAAVNVHNPVAPSSVTLPMLLTVARTWCNISATDTNVVRYDFNVIP